MPSIFEPPPRPEPEDPRQRVWDAIQIALGAWGLYELLAQILGKARK